MFKIKKIIKYILYILFCIFLIWDNAFSIDNQDLDVLKYRNYRINVYNANQQCKDYTTLIQNKEMGTNEVSIVDKYYMSSLVIRWDEANNIKSFNITTFCPLQINFSFVYSLYDNWNLNIFLNKCWLSSSKKYYYLNDYNTFKINYKDKYWTNQKLCIYYPNNVSNFKILGVNNVWVIHNNIVLENKLWLNNYFISIAISLLLFILTLAFIIYRKWFQI